MSTFEPNQVLDHCKVLVWVQHRVACQNGVRKSGLEKEIDTYSQGRPLRKDIKHEKRCLDEEQWLSHGIPIPTFWEFQPEVSCALFLIKTVYLLLP